MRILPLHVEGRKSSILLYRSASAHWRRRLGPGKRIFRTVRHHALLVQTLIVGGTVHVGILGNALLASLS